MSDLYSAWANYGKQRREEEAQKKLVMPTASALQRFGNIAPVPGTDMNPRTNPAMSPPAPDMREFAPGTRLGQTESGMAAYKAEQDRMAAEAARSEQELQRKEISQYADLYEDTDPEFADFVRMGVNTGILKDKKDVIDVFSKYMESQRGKKETAGKQAFESGENALNRQSRERTAAVLANQKKEEKDEKQKEIDDVAQLERDDTTELINQIRNSKAAATGLNPKRLLAAVQGTPEYDWAQNVQQLKDKIALNNRAKLKGSGQISDIEQKMLQRASTKLSTALTKEAFLEELDNLETTIRSMGDVNMRKYNKGNGSPNPVSDFDALWGD